MDYENLGDGSAAFTYRDGSVRIGGEIPLYIGGTAPVPGRGRGLNIFSWIRNAFGPRSNWIRGPKGSYSQSMGKNTERTVSWGASNAKKGKYVKQIGNKTLRRFNQYLRGRRLPPGKKSWRTRDPGHLHLDKKKPN